MKKLTECEKCLGEGKLFDGYNITGCRFCNGTGKVSKIDEDSDDNFVDEDLTDIFEEFDENKFYNDEVNPTDFDINE